MSDVWYDIATAPRDATWFYAKALIFDHEVIRVVHFDDAADRFPIHEGMVPWPVAPTQWKPLKADLCVTRADLDAAVALALEEAASTAANACLVEPDGGSPTEEERLVCELAYHRILALIQPHQAEALARVRQEAHNAAIEAAVVEIGRKVYPLGSADDWSEKGKHLATGLDMAIAALRALALPVDGGAQV